MNNMNDYYAFGSPMPGRNYVGATDYRYGYNGKERDPETVSTAGNTYDYGFRIYNPNLARFLSIDPLTKEYPWYTPYQFAGNIPIAFIDRDGLEPTAPPVVAGTIVVGRPAVATSTNPNLAGAPPRAAATLTTNGFRRASDSEVKRAQENGFANNDVFFVPDIGARNGQLGEYFYRRPLVGSGGGAMVAVTANGNIFESATSKFFSSVNRQGIQALNTALAAVKAFDTPRLTTINITVTGNETPAVLTSRANEIRQRFIDNDFRGSFNIVTTPTAGPSSITITASDGI
jgi:RHS repeat-associated protein